jgi:hypothetical protein
MAPTLAEVADSCITNCAQVFILQADAVAALQGAPHPSVVLRRKGRCVAMGRSLGWERQKDVTAGRRRALQGNPYIRRRVASLTRPVVILGLAPADPQMLLNSYGIPA